MGNPPSWLQGVPNRLVDRLKWSPDCSAAQLPKDAIVMPFAGKDDAASLEAILHAQAPGLAPRVMAFDSCRKADGKDILDDALYGALCTAALHGCLSFVGACPDFRTWGKDRWFQDSGDFHAERSRNPRDAWGIQALPAEALRIADEESLRPKPYRVLLELTFQHARFGGWISGGWILRVVKNQIHQKSSKFIKSHQKLSKVIKSYQKFKIRN